MHWIEQLRKKIIFYILIFPEGTEQKRKPKIIKQYANAKRAGRKKAGKTKEKACENEKEIRPKPAHAHLARGEKIVWYVT